MSFDNPRSLLALLFLIPAAFLAFLHYRKRRAVLDFLDTGDGLVSKLRFRYRISTIFFWLFLACTIIALAQPRGGVRLVSETRRGVDVVFAIDLSRSMNVRDIVPGGPSRLGRAASLIMELVNNPWFTRSPGVRFGAAIGKGRGVLALPLTGDTEAIQSFLSSLSSAAITGRGTNLELLIDAAAAAFQDAFPSRRLTILLSDGESLAGSMDAAMDRAASAGITLIAVGLGSEEGGAVPLGNGSADPYNTGSQGSLLGEDGYPVLSALRKDTLKDAAEKTGGIYIDGNRGNAAALLADYLASQAAPDNGASVRGFRRETRPLGYIFVIAALVFMGISKIAEYRLPAGMGRRKHG
ncbi:BatB protein [Spirochaetia bacterium]|nr:BatB protein [Spirochaetia bacterium]